MFKIIAILSLVLSIMGGYYYIIVLPQKQLQKQLLIKQNIINNLQIKNSEIKADDFTDYWKTKIILKEPYEKIDINDTCGDHTITL